MPLKKGLVHIPLWLVGGAVAGTLLLLGITGKLDDLIKAITLIATSAWSMLDYAFKNLQIFFAIIGLIVNPEYPGTWTKVFLSVFILGPMILTLVWIIMNFIRGRGRS